MVESSTEKDEVRWRTLLDFVDEKMQFALLEHLRRVDQYHFDGEILYLHLEAAEEVEYFSRPSTLQHLELLAQDCLKIERVKIK